ncbi:hypothetical protein EZS27_016700 [termite gut metagenome]|uniref:Uncharacterized protein n=1 Tax=termite gut metagenome TaxID=433724 RepID=A0A5J4RMB2_9ZZZZ
MNTNKKAQKATEEKEACKRLVECLKQEHANHDLAGELLRMNMLQIIDTYIQKVRESNRLYYFIIGNGYLAEWEKYCMNEKK